MARQERPRQRRGGLDHGDRRHRGTRAEHARNAPASPARRWCCSPATTGSPRMSAQPSSKRAAITPAARCAATRVTPGKAAIAWPSSCAGPAWSNPAASAANSSTKPTSWRRWPTSSAQKLPDNAGEDSFSLLPLLQGEDKPIRQHAVSCAMSGVPALRRRLETHRRGLRQRRIQREPAADRAGDARTPVQPGRRSRRNQEPGFRAPRTRR